MATVTYDEIQNIRIERIAQFLTKPGNIDHGLRRNTLARHLSTDAVQITGTMVTQLWPRIEARIISIGKERGTPLFPCRPMAAWGYRCAATSTPIVALVMATKRERTQVTQMRNDAIGGLSEHLTTYGHLFDRDQEREVWRRIDRRDTYLAAYDRHIADLTEAEAMMMLEIVTMPDIELVEP
jgi:hypothetical protein